MAKTDSDSIVEIISDIASGAKEPFAFTVLMGALLLFFTIAPWVFVIGVGLLSAIIIMVIGYGIIGLFFFPKTVISLVK